MAPQVEAPRPDLHAAWAAVLARYGGDGDFDYAGLQAARGELARYLDVLRSVDRIQYERMPPAEQAAFWINAHNAYAVDLVLQFWPVGSILEATPMVRRGAGGPFNLERIPLGHVLGRDGDLLSLNDVADDVLHERFADPRLHFALARACKSCPAVSPEPFRGERLDSQLDEAARRFIADPRRNRFDAERRELVVSPLFQWHASDFQAWGGPAGAFERYAPAVTKKALASLVGPPMVRYPAYDWSLNAR